MPANKIITWDGVNHELRLYFKDGRTYVMLILDKTKGVEPLLAYCDGDVCVGTFAAWEKQGNAWDEVRKVDKTAVGGTFFAERVIEIAGGCWHWLVNHYDDAPDDSFKFMRGITADELRRKGS